MAAWITLAAVGMAVAIPSAPGFFGTYHAACKLALEPFGVAPETAVALGTLLHAMFWVDPHRARLRGAALAPHLLGRARTGRGALRGLLPRGQRPVKLPVWSADNPAGSQRFPTVPKRGAEIVLGTRLDRFALRSRARADAESGGEVDGR